MKRTKVKHLIFISLFILFLPLLVFAQNNSFPEIDKYFSIKEKAIFEHALEYQNAFYNKIFPDVNVDLSEIKISVITDVKYFGDLAVLPVIKKSSGFYSPVDRELVIIKTEKMKHAFMETAIHELSHALLHLYSEFQFNHIPPWLNEGIAVYLSGMSYSSKKMVHKKNDYLIARVKTLIELRDLDLASFVNWGHQKFTKESFSQEGYGYAVGYCIVLFLMKKDEKYAYTLFRSLIEKSDKPTTEIFDNYYDGGFSKFEKDFILFFR